MLRTACSAWIALLVLTGCERGCASRWLASRGSGPDAADLLPVSVIDCPDGLARCSGGQLEVSVLATRPFPCSGPAARCDCPWIRVDECALGCVYECPDCANDDKAFVLPKADVKRLCKVSDVVQLWRPTLRTLEPTTRLCTSEAFHCVDGLVVACEDRGAASDAARVVAECTRGCSASMATIDQSVPFEAAITLLCGH